MKTNDMITGLLVLLMSVVIISCSGGGEPVSSDIEESEENISGSHNAAWKLGTGTFIDRIITGLPSNICHSVL